MAPIKVTLRSSRLPELKYVLNFSHDWSAY